MACEVKQDRRDLLKFIQLIMSTKTKAEIQLETWNYLHCNGAIFKEYLKDLIDSCEDVPFHKNVTMFDYQTKPKYKAYTNVSEQDDENERNYNSFSIRQTYKPEENENTNFSRIESTQESNKHQSFTETRHLQQEQTKNHKQSTTKMRIKAKIKDKSTVYTRNDNQGIETITSAADESSNDSINLSMETASTCTSNHESSSWKTLKRKRSFSQNNFERDILHQKKSREPDASLLNVKPLIDTLMLHVCYGVGEDNFAFLKNAGTEEKYLIAKSMINSLINSTSAQQQENVLKALRSDEALRQIFLKESSDMGKVKIPVFRHRKILNVRKNSLGKRSEGTIDSGDDNLQADNIFVRKANTSVEESSDSSNFFENENFDLIQFIARSFEPRESEYSVTKNVVIPTKSTPPFIPDEGSQCDYTGNRYVPTTSESEFCLLPNIHFNNDEDESKITCVEVNDTTSHVPLITGQITRHDPQTENNQILKIKPFVLDANLYKNLQGYA